MHVLYIASNVPTRFSIADYLTWRGRGGFPTHDRHLGRRVALVCLT